MNKKLFINASKGYSWEDGYDEFFPYNLSLTEYEATTSHSWTVGTLDVEIDVPTKEHVVSCQVNGLEATLLELEATYYKAKENLEEQLNELKCLPAPVAPVDGLNES